MSTKIGLQGELIASSLLLNYGIDNDLVSKEGYDIIAWINAKPFRVQVKATSKPHKETGETKYRYNWNLGYGADKKPYTHNECDIIILVALDKRICHFMLPNNNKSKKMYISKMTLENEEKTFYSVIDNVKNKCLCR
tara:strand:+ start:292 stop:702 length:411 start_codon:yes stop_codon:yes gene_type:complete